MEMTVNRNSLCPCGSGRKYKKCCLGERDWELLLKNPAAIPVNLTVRGKNMLFLNTVAEILGIPSEATRIEWALLKNRITPDVVGQVHQLLREIWPSSQDLLRVIQNKDELPGLYIGSYVPEAVLRTVTKHVLYAESIYFFDPLVYPGSTRPEYDPLCHPERYVSHTIKCLYIWMNLAPAIDAGILRIIRSPCDFDNNLRLRSLVAEDRRLSRHPDLRRLIDYEVAAMHTQTGEISWMKDYMHLCIPDHQIVDCLLQAGFSQSDIEEHLNIRAEQKREHPFFTEYAETEVFCAMAGECHSISSMVAEQSGSFLLTDNQARWRMIELDRKDKLVDDAAWEPFAASVQKAPLKYLNNLTVKDCVRLRQEGLLHRMRRFMKRTWTESKGADDFSRTTVEQFAAELEEQVELAEQEWNEIDGRLLKWFSSEIVAGVATVPAVGFANAGWLASAVALAGVSNLIEAHWDRRRLPRRMPGAFFLGPKKRD